MKPRANIDWLDIAKTVYDLCCRVNKLEDEIKKLKRKPQSRIKPLKKTEKNNG